MVTDLFVRAPFRERSETPLAHLVQFLEVLFTRECNETSIAGGEKALTRSIAHSIL